MTPELRIYTPDSSLRHPAAFLGQLRKDLSASRELAWRLFVRDLSAQYRGAFFGYLWVFAPPLLTSVPFIYLHSAGVLQSADTGVPYAAYALTGTTIWQTFVDGLNSPIRAAQGARSILTRINFPPEAILVAGMLQVGFNFVVRAALLAVVYVLLGLHLPATAPLFLAGALSIALAGFTIGLLLTPVAMLYADVQHVLPLATTGAMLLTPVLYPVPRAGLARVVSALNPLTPLVVTTRAWLTTGPVDSAGFLIITAVMLALLTIGWITYRVALPHLIARFGN